MIDDGKGERTIPVFLHLPFCTSVFILRSSPSRLLHRSLSGSVPLHMTIQNPFLVKIWAQNESLQHHTAGGTCIEKLKYGNTSSKPLRFLYCYYSFNNFSSSARLSGDNFSIAFWDSMENCLMNNTWSIGNTAWVRCLLS